MIKKFEINTEELSKSEKEVLKKLIQAAELISFLYEEQKNSKYEGSNFYPSDATKQELEQAAEKDPDILSPYTFVEKDESGKLKAIPFHIKFKNKLESISKLLEQASELSEDKNLAEYLKSRAKALLTDDYDESNILWLETEKSKIGCVIGPFDRYLDKLFFKKRAYMAWIGILDEKRTNTAERIKSMALTSERRFLSGAKKTKIPRTRVRIEHTAIFSGLVADFMFVGNNLPSSADIYLIKEHGTLFTVFNPSIKLRFEQWILPVFKNTFDKGIQKKYSEKELFTAFLRSIVLHEACHSIMRYEDAATRLEEYFPFFDELYTDILAVKGYESLFLKDVVTQKELEVFLIVYICRHLHWLTAVKKQPHTIHYATGGAISLKFLLDAGALRKRLGGRFGAMFLPDFRKVAIGVDKISSVLEYYLSLGSHEEAKEFIKNYGSFEVFEQFISKLKDLSEDRK
ncbi:MAG: hypothetical protein ISS87_00105 [Candidatus Pacebacteria bacterium]|nr:hypothetical protein [Candidatus Paceibacterota bacterium]